MTKPIPFFAALFLCVLTNVMGLLFIWIPGKIYDWITGSNVVPFSGGFDLLIFYLVLINIPIFVLLWIALSAMMRKERPVKDIARETLWMIVVLIFFPVFLANLGNLLHGNFGFLIFATAFGLSLRLSVWLVFRWPETRPPESGAPLDADL